MRTFALVLTLVATLLVGAQAPVSAQKAIDLDSATIAELSETDVQQLTSSGTAHSGMVAKLTACRRARNGGVTEVAIVAGRGVEDFDTAVGTRVF